MAKLLHFKENAIPCSVTGVDSVKFLVCHVTDSPRGEIPSSFDSGPNLLPNQQNPVFSPFMRLNSEISWLHVAVIAVHTLPVEGFSVSGKSIPQYQVTEKLGAAVMAGCNAKLQLTPTMRVLPRHPPPSGRT
jgi:hypothetical protein